METLLYFSRNNKKPPFKVTIKIDDKRVYINCDCPLGTEGKICRHKINAIRANKEYCAPPTSEQTVDKLRYLFSLNHSTLRQHLEENWLDIREYSYKFPEDKEEIENKRKILGESFRCGFINNFCELDNTVPFNGNEWEENREIIASGLNCHAEITYNGSDGLSTNREVDIHEIFVVNSQYYFSAYCYLRNQIRTFKVDKIQEMKIDQGCSKENINEILNTINKNI